MPGTYLNYPFDEEIFFQMWNEEPDPIKNAMLASGVLVNDALIAGKIGNNSNFYTIPFYNVLAGSPVNYNGQTDIPSEETKGDSQSGIVYGRAKGFTARNFVAELSGSDPMGYITSTIAKWWNKYRQSVIIGILNGVFGITGDAEWGKHTIPVDSPIEETTLNNAATDALGDNKDAVSLAIMHSQVAKTLENKQLLDYWKYTDAAGITRNLKIGSVNGYTVIIDDGVPHTPADGTNSAQYTTYLMGTGFLRNAQGRVDVPVEVARDPAKNGGQDTLYTRIRETIHPNGFSYSIPTSGWTESPTDAQLFASARWARKFNAKAIPAIKITTQG